MAAATSAHWPSNRAGSSGWLRTATCQTCSAGRSPSRGFNRGVQEQRQISERHPAGMAGRTRQIRIPGRDLAGVGVAWLDRQRRAAGRGSVSAREIAPMELRTGAGSRGPAAGTRSPGVLRRCGGRSARPPITPPPCRFRPRLRRSPSAASATTPGPPPGGPSTPAAQRCPAPTGRARGGCGATAPRAGQCHRSGQQAQAQDDGLVPGCLGPRAARAAVPAGTAAPVQRRLPVLTTAPPVQHLPAASRNTRTTMPVIAVRLRHRHVPVL